MQEMKVQMVKVFQMGVNIEIKICVNGLVFYSHYGFASVQEAQEALADYELHEMEYTVKGN